MTLQSATLGEEDQVEHLLIQPFCSMIQKNAVFSFSVSNVQKKSVQSRLILFSLYLSTEARRAGAAESWTSPGGMAHLFS